MEHHAKRSDSPPNSSPGPCVVPSFGLLPLFPCHLAQDLGIPRKAFGIVILSHMRSRTSSPDSGAAMALVTEAMSMWIERPRPSQPYRRDNRELMKGPLIQGGGEGDRETHHQAERSQM